MTGRRKFNRFRVRTPDAASLARYLLTYSSEKLYHRPKSCTPISSVTVFGNNHPCIFDLGCGRGEFVVDLAQRCPQKNFIGFDAHRKSLYAAVNKASELQLANLKLVQADLRWAFEVVPAQSVETIFLLFPAPALKRKQRKKDVMTPMFIQQIAHVLQPEGHFHFVTDSRPYFEKKLQMIERLAVLTLKSQTYAIEGSLTRYQNFWEQFQVWSSRGLYVKRN